MLTITDLHKSYPTPQGPLPVLRGVDLSLARGASLALMGESGSGKSTLLHLAGGLDRADTGSIIVNGEDITALDEAGRASYRRKTVGLVFQQFNLIPSLSVADNIAFHAKLADRHDADWARELTETLGLGTLLNRYPEQLSGGQQQRVAIARTLAARPALVLADEPTGNLDETTSEVGLDLMISLSRSAGSALLLVTHSSRMASKLDRQVVLRGGKIVA